MSAEQGGKRNKEKTIVTLYADAQTAVAKQEEWKLSELGKICTVAHMADRGKTLGVALGSRRIRADEFRKKTKVVRAMHAQTRPPARKPVPREFVLHM